MYNNKITREHLASLKKKKDVLVADIRNPEFFRDASIKDSTNLYPIRSFTNYLQTIQNKKQPIIIVSTDIEDEDATAGQMYAERMGFENVFISDFVSLRED